MANHGRKWNTGNLVLFKTCTVIFLFCFSQFKLFLQSGGEPFPLIWSSPMDFRDFGLGVVMYVNSEKKKIDLV